MSAATIVFKCTNINCSIHQKHALSVKLLLLLIVIVLHLGLALILINPATIEISKQPVFMEISMLSVTATAPKPMEKAPLSIKKEPITPPPIVKKQRQSTNKKSALIIPSEPALSPQLTANSAPLDKSVPSLVIDSQVESSVNPSVEAISKNAESNSHEHESDKNTVISGIMPLVKVNPVYPNRAVSHAIEGWVKIEFTIQADGSVANAVVMQSKPEDVFDEAALIAINQWQFKPKMVNGVAVEQRAAQLLQFKLDH